MTQTLFVRSSIAYLLNMSDAEKVNVRVDVESLEQPGGLLAELVAKVQRRPIDPCLLRSMRFSGAMTNVVYKVWVEGIDGSYIIRIMDHAHEEDGVVDAISEEWTFSLLSAHNIGPRCLLYFQNGRIEEFFEEFRALHGSDEMCFHMWHNIPVALARFHSMSTYASRTEPWQGSRSMQKYSMCLWNRMHGWYRHLRRCERPKHDHAWIEDFLKDMDSILHSQNCSQDTVYIGESLIHGDLQCGNILVNPSGDVRFIDYDYSCFGDVAFDIANFFCEIGSDYNSDPGKAVFHWEKVPNKSDRRKFVQLYIQSLVREEYSWCLVSPSKMDDVEQLCDHVSNRVDWYMNTVSPLHWCAWALVFHFSCKDKALEFDYLAYAHERYNQFSDNPILD
jgi:thiamine kinase-like enzyme